MRKVLHSWAPVFFWCSLIFFLSSQPHLPGPEDVSLDFLLKKLGHVTVYGVLFSLVHRAFGVGTRYRVVKTLLFCILYALSDEYHQSFVPGRTPMLRDVGIDIFGMILALGIRNRLHGKKR